MSDKIRMSGLISGLDTDSVIEALVSNKRQKVTNAEGDQKKLEWKQDLWKDINTNIKALQQTYIAKMRFGSAFSKKTTSVSSSSVASVVTGEGAVDATQKLKVEKLAKTAYLTGADLNGASTAKSYTASTKLSELGYGDGKTDTISINIGGEVKETLAVDENTTISDVLSSLKKAGLNASFDENTQRIFVSSKSTGASKDFTLTDSNGALSALGLATATKAQMQDENFDQSKFATKIDGSDAVIYLNNAKFTSDSNTFKINNLTITALEETGDKEVTLTTQTDTSGIYGMIKDMITQYNKVINQIDKYYNAESARKYTMLTDEQKEALSEDEVEKYENKIKDSLLRRDTNLLNLRNIFTGVMSSGIEIGGKTMYLSDFGVGTGSYFDTADDEKHALHIDGDEDDPTSSTKADKLSALIASDPDKVQEFFTKLSQDLYSKLSNVSKSVDGYRSFGNFYDDKKMKSDYDGYKKTIATLEEKANDYEDSLYRKFSAMEKAMANLQSKTNALSGLLGVSSN